MCGVGCAARRSYVHADIYRNFYWWEAGGVVAGLVAEGDGKSYGADGGVIVGDEAEFQNYGGGIYVETFVGREGKFFSRSPKPVGSFGVRVVAIRYLSVG
jgi:hypothetical protein